MFFSIHLPVLLPRLKASGAWFACYGQWSGLAGGWAITVDCYTIHYRYQVVNKSQFQPTPSFLFASCFKGCLPKLLVALQQF
ncbi:MAG: hypothetical protein EAY75_15760 [Bacteroidetes bacterium]|nr:MAG: hypothetical protein EAY75_15760 [Bacteroidota bacterium]